MCTAPQQVEAAFSMLVEIAVITILVKTPFGESIEKLISRKLWIVMVGFATLLFLKNALALTGCSFLQ